MGKQVGYARVSTKGQNLSRQMEALKRYVPDDMIVTDKASGKDFERMGYNSLKIGIGKLVKGDTLYITSLDRLGRNKEETKKELEYFHQIGVRVKILDIPTTMIEVSQGQDWVVDMINNILIEVLASVAENERQTIHKRQAEGIACMPIDPKSRKRVSVKTGRAVGRPPVSFPKEWDDVYSQWKNGAITGVQAMRELSLKKNSFYNLVKRYEAKRADIK